MAWLDRLPYLILAPIAIVLAIVPLGAPHLIEKLRMLAGGTLRRPLDWFDLLMHGTPLLLLIAKLALSMRRAG